jgi:hypothetical protein
MAFNTTVLDRNLREWVSKGMDFYHATLIMKCVEMVNCHCEADPEFKEKCFRAFGEDDFEMIAVWEMDNTLPDEDE